MFSEKCSFVKVEDKMVSSIKNGMLILLGISNDDSREDIIKMTNKISKLRIFNDENDIMNKNVNEVNGEVLVVSQFTLYGNVRKGNRPSNINSAKTDIAGMLRTANRKNFFTPDNDTDKNIWFSINLKDVQKITGKKFNKYIVYLEDQNIELPKPKKITVDVPNNHLKYAITWYSISISILFYYLYFRRKK